MNRLVRLLDRFWFVEAPATRLAALRILVGLFALVYLGLRFTAFSNIASSSPDLFEPVGLASLLSAPVPAEAFRVVLALTVVANVAFLLGWQYRYTGPLFGALLLWVLCYRNSWGMIYHNYNLLVLHALILGLARAEDALSLDALARSRYDGRGRGLLGNWRIREAAGGWEYGYPIRLICTVTVITYFLSGVAKVAEEQGWSWALGEAMRTQVAFDGLRKEFLQTGAPALAFILFQQTWLFAIMGIGTLVLELGAPLALLDKRLAYLWVLGAFPMHWGILFIMGIEFPYQLSGLAFASFFQLERVASWLRPRRIWEKLAGKSLPRGAPVDQPAT